MSRSDLAGKTLLANIKTKKSEIMSMENENSDLYEIGIKEKEIFENSNMEINIEDYYDKPLEVLINDANKFDNKDNNAIDIEFTDVLEVIEEGLELELVDN
ncbi:MAG: hypothetical protein ACRC41_06820, partial [Sarcina sp.]